MVAWDTAPTVESSWTDAICDLQGLEITTGQPTPDGIFESGELTASLDNRTGEWSLRNAAGQLVEWLIGRNLAVWAEVEGEPYWLFFGEVTAWRETADGTVELEAFDAFSRLNQQIGEWDPGSDGDTIPERITNVLTLIGYTEPSRLDEGDVTLLGPTSDRTVLEELQLTALSDGGILLVDADGTLVYRNRGWTSGRDDQPTPPVTLGTNICTADAVVWDPVLTTDDYILANSIALANVAVPTPIAVSAEDLSAQVLHGIITLSDPRDEDLWETEVQGQALADHLLARRAPSSLRVESCTLHLMDPRQPQLWTLGVDFRLGDIIELLHEQPAAGGGVQLLDLYVAVAHITHQITPESWVMTLSTTRTLGNRPAFRWDDDGLFWDSDPASTWGH